MAAFVSVRDGDDAVVETVIDRSGRVTQSGRSRIRGSLGQAAFGGSRSVVGASVSHAGTPVRSAGRVVAALGVISHVPRRYSDGELELLASLADALGAELELRAAEQEQRRGRELLAAFNAIHEMIAADAPVEDVLGAIVQSIETYDPEASGSVLLVDPSGSVVHPGAAPSLPRSIIHAFDGLPIGPAAGSCGTAAYLGEVVVSADIATDPRWADYRHVVEPHGLRRCWSYPILGSDGDALGAFGIYGRLPGEPTEDQNEFFRDAARLAAIALERRATLERLGYAAAHDALTGLPNRSAAVERLREALARGRRSGSPVGVMLCDLDRLRLINDTLGPDQGDLAVQLAARRLVESVRPGDIVARVAGDEFLVITEGLDAAALPSVAQRLVEAVREASDDGLALTFSVGVTAIEDESEAGEALRRAELALKAAQQAGGNRFTIHSGDGFERDARQSAIELALRGAVARGELHLAFQPIHRFADGEPLGMEALLRWTHPALGVVSPAEFIPIAEQSGAIEELGNWVLERACRAAVAWTVPLSIGVNVSACQLRRGDFAATVAGCLERSGLAAARLTLEVTETALLGTDPVTDANLNDLASLGIALVLDDFGTGFSSLAALKRHRLSGIKIDRSFVSGLPDCAEDRAIVSALIGMAHALDLRVVAEGIENDAQYSQLRELACDHAQGFLLGHPVPEHELMLTA